MSMEEVDFDTVEENWSIYKLKDGSTLKIKLIMTGVKRAIGQYDPLGNPLYLFASQNIVKLSNVPLSLQKPKENKPI